jgi:NTP pyrophosphatase (non-canonical NTP hydrolase)
MDNYTKDIIYIAGSNLQYLCHQASVKAGWDEGVDYTNKYVVAAKIMLAVTELSEAVEASRKDLMDDKLPHRNGVEVELADALIRIFHLGGAMGFDLGRAIQEKMIYNSERADHKPENRAKEGGKKI